MNRVGGRKSRLALIPAGVALTLVFPPLAQATDIGPDAFGYSATDEAAFSWIDISPTGTPALSGVDDSPAASANLGFTFNFYGADYTSVDWSANGLLTFGGPNTQFTNVDLTTASPFANAPTIAALWDDWEFISDGSDQTYYQTLGSPGSQMFVVQWNDANGFFESPSPVTFEAILFEGSNDILLQYADVDSGDSRSFGGESTVGIRDIDGESNGRVLQWSFDNNVIPNQYAIRFSTGEPVTPSPVIPEPASLSLMTLGLLGLGVAKRSRNARRSSRT